MHKCIIEDSVSVPGSPAAGSHPQLEEYAMEQSGKSKTCSLLASRATRRGMLAVPLNNGETLILWVSVERPQRSEQGELARQDEPAPADQRANGLGVTPADLFRLHSWRGLGKVGR